MDRDQGWQVDGAVSAHGWLTAHTPASRAEATDLVRAARFRRRFEATAARLASGELSAARFKTLARRVTAERVELYERDESMMVDWRRRWAAPMTCGWSWRGGRRWPMTSWPPPMPMPPTRAGDCRCRGA